MYQLEMRFGFNNKLLNLKENQKTEVHVDSMTPEEMKEFIKKMIGIYISSTTTRRERESVNLSMVYFAR